MTRIDLNEIKQKLTMENVCGHYNIQVGRNGKAICPFHNDHKPSMQVYPDDGGFHCFTCKISGSVIDFIQRMENVSFGEAVHIAAELAGIEEKIPKRERAAQSNALNLERQKAQEAQKEYIRLTTRMNTVLRPMAEKLEGFTMEDEITDDIERFMDEFAETEAKIDAIDEQLRDYRERGML